MNPLATFSLTKWYLDCVDARGRAAIAYWTALAWLGLDLTWQSILVYEPEDAAGGSRRPSLQRSSRARGPAPRRDACALSWDAPALGCAVAMEARQPPMAVRLLDSEAGAVDWHCEAPAADTHLRLEGQRPVSGQGYAERLILTLAPWRLPIDQLRWGRWIAADASRSVVWIDWRGELPRSWVFVDGQRQELAAVGGEGVTAGETSLRLDASQLLPARSLREVVATIAPLAALVPSSLLGLRQTRWRSTGTLHGAGRAPLGGWAIHELVTFGNPRPRPGPRRAEKRSAHAGRRATNAGTRSADAGTADGSPA
jgi:hypothetical protein